MVCILLNSAFIPGMASAQGDRTSPPDFINDTTPLPGSDLYPVVTLNGNPVGLVHLGYAGGKLYASRNTLHRMGLRLPKDNLAEKTVCLSDIFQLRVDYNTQQQTLALSAPLSMLALATTRITPYDEPGPEVATSRGALLNYDVYMEQGKTTVANTFSELRAFSPAGVLSTTQLTRCSIGGNDDTFSRLDSSWRVLFPDKRLNITLGDTLTRSLPWSRPTRIAGIQVGTDFSLQPYMSTTPLPAFLGSATLPSRIELYVNGVKSYKREVPAGNFQLDIMPVVSGTGEASVIMTDTLGRTTVQNFSFYNDQQLLREGLTSWSAELGVVRENYGYYSFDYTDSPVLSGSWRQGINNTLSTGVHAEADKRLMNIGVGNDWIPGRRSGMFSTSLAMSDDEGKSGFQYGVGYRWSEELFSFSTNTLAAVGDYHDIAARYGQAPPILNSNTIVGYSMGREGIISLSYLQLRYSHNDAERYAAANWYKSVTDNVFLNASVSQNVDDRHNLSLYLMFTMTSGNNISTSSSLQRTRDKTGYQLNASRPPSEEGWGWNVVASQQASLQSCQGEFGYQGRYGKTYAGFSNNPSTQHGYAGATGSLVMMGGGLFAARQITHGFAVVSTDGVPGVPIRLQNNPVGKSDAQGQLLVTELNSYQNNEISIDPMALPAGMRISRVTENVTPADRAGALVHFGITPIRAAQVILVDRHGNFIPEGSTVKLTSGEQQSAVVGFDGMAYLDTLNLHNHLLVSTETGQCLVQFDYPLKTTGIAQMGPLVCQ